MKPIILDDSRALNELTTDFSNGLGRLSECKNAQVVEEANGIYEAAFDIPVIAAHFKDLHVDGIVKLKANETDENQLFRIYRITKPLDGICTVSLQHISYDLTKAAVTPFKTVGAGAAMQAIQSHMVGTYPFIFNTDISNTTSSYEVATPVSGRSCIGGREGSFIDVFGGEVHWNNLAVNVFAHRGHDNNVRISYGKNLIDYRQEVNNANVYNAVLGYATRDDATITGDIQYATQTASPKTLIVDFTSEFDSDEEITVAKVNAKAQAYISSHDIGTPNINIDVDFVHLWQTKEYQSLASLERVSLFDTVHVYIPKLDVEATAKVVKTVYDPIAERFKKIELGNVRANLGSVITKAVDDQINNASSELYGKISGQIQAQIDRATAFITGAEGGYQVTHYHADGTPYETLWMNTDSEATATNILRINANGLGFSNDGGVTYRNAWLIDGTLNADFIGSGTITAINIVGSNLTFGDSPNTVTLRTNDTLDGALFEGEGVMQFETHGEFFAKNMDSDSYVANQIRMRSNVLLNNVDTNQISFLNKRDGITANEFYANADDTSHEFWFYNNRPGIARNANNHYMGATATGYFNRLYNYKFNALTQSDGVISANDLLLGSVAERNYAALENRQTEGYRRNYLFMNAYDPDIEDTNADRSVIWLDNLKESDTSSEYIANRIYMNYQPNASSPANDFSLRNYDIDNNVTANYQSMSSSADRNSVYLYNDGVDGRVKNVISLWHSKSSLYNSIFMNNNNNDAQTANSFSLTGSGADNHISFFNKFLSSTDTANETQFEGNSSGYISYWTKNYDRNNHKIANMIFMSSRPVSHSINGAVIPANNSLNLVNYQTNANEIVNSRFVMNDNMLFECQNRTTFSFIGNGKQFAVINANNGVCIAADGVAVDSFLAAGKVHIVAPNGLYITDQNGSRTRQL